MALWVPSETTSWLVWTLGWWFRGGDNLFNRLRLDVTYLQTLVGHKSDQMGVVVCLSDGEREVKARNIHLLKRDLQTVTG